MSMLFLIWLRYEFLFIFKNYLTLFENKEENGYFMLPDIL